MRFINMNGALCFASGIDYTGMYWETEETKRIVNLISDSLRSAGMISGADFGTQILTSFYLS